MKKVENYIQGGLYYFGVAYRSIMTVVLNDKRNITKYAYYQSKEIHLIIGNYNFEDPIYGIRK